MGGRGWESGCNGDLSAVVSARSWQRNIDYVAYIIVSGHADL